MKPDVILHLNLNLESNYLDAQLDNLRKILKQLKEMPEFENVKVQVVKDEIGLNEERYLEITGKSRMNHRHKDMTREQQAAHYLKELGVDTFPISDTVESVDNESIPLEERGAQAVSTENDEDPLA
jgi:pimeloyl-CoA synthetase